MKNLKLILFFITIIGCKNINKTTIEGNWYSCNKRGDYIEFLVRDSQYRYSTGWGFITPWFKYEIRGDTLIQYDNNDIYNSIVVKKSIINLTKDGNLLIDYLSSNEKWIFYRIKDPVNYSGSDEVFLKETNKRSREINCQDTRSNEEKKQDSVTNIIDFKF